MLQHAANTHFQQLFQEDGNSDEKLNVYFLSNIPSLVSHEHNAKLVKPFSEQEVVDVIWSMKPDKNPRGGWVFHPLLQSLLVHY